METQSMSRFSGGRCFFYLLILVFLTGEAIRKEKPTSLRSVS